MCCFYKMENLLYKLVQAPSLAMPVPEGRKVTKESQSPQDWQHSDTLCEKGIRYSDSDRSNNHRPVQCGKEPQASSDPTPPCSTRATLSHLPRTMSRWLWNTSRDGDSTTSLGDLCRHCHPHSNDSIK